MPNWNELGVEGVLVGSIWQFGVGPLRPLLIELGHLLVFGGESAFPSVV